MEKIQIGFLGYGTRALDALMVHPKYEVRYFFAPRARLCQDVYDAAERYKDKLTLEVIDDNRMLAERLAQIKDVECFLMNACSIILKQDVLDEMPFYNIHPGDLAYNRGHQPHMWTVRLGEKSSKIELHKVCTGIDEGYIVCSKKMPVSPEQSAGEVLNMLEDQIPCLLDGLYAHLREGAPYEEEIMGGTYRPVMKYEDYRVDFTKAGESDFDNDMKRKLLSRSENHGAFFVHEGRRIYFTQILERGKTAKQDYHVEIRDGRVIVEACGHRYILLLSKIEDNAQ